MKDRTTCQTVELTGVTALTNRVVAVFPSMGGVMRAGAMLSVLSVLWLSHTASGHVGERVYPILEISDEMMASVVLHDGSVEEWSDWSNEPLVSGFEFTPSDLPAVTTKEFDPSDLDFRIWLGWNDSTNRLYLAAEFVDDAYFNEYSGFPEELGFEGADSISLMVDGDHSGGSFGPDPVVAGRLNTEAQRYEAIARSPDGDNVLLLLQDADGVVSPGKWMTQPPFGDGGGGVAGESPTFWVIEFFVTAFDLVLPDDPDGSFVSDLRAGDSIGFSISVIDQDNPDEWIHGLYDLRDVGSLEDNDLLLDGILLGSEGASGSTTTVNGLSWGRVN